MKKTKILFILVLGILLLGLGYQVYGKYVLSKTIQIPFTTSWATEVSITTTKDNAQTATINATAEDNSAGVKKYDFYINDELKQTVTTSDLTASYSFDYASTFGTTYDTYVVVTDNNDATSKSNTSTIVDYTISTKQDMELFSDSVNNGNVYENETIIQTADIDLQGSETNKWIPIGEKNDTSSFYGTYEGNNYSISGIYIDNDNAWQGLFKNIHANGTVRNVKLENGTIKANDRSAGIAGGNSGLIIGCINSCNIEGDYAGQAGIVGVNNGRIVNCYNIGSVVGNITDGVFEDIGGIASINEENGIIENCYNLGDISVNATNNIYTIGYDAGGIAGENKGIIRNCYNMGNIDVSLIGRVGGINGWNSGGTVYNCYSATTVIRGVDVGGVVGDNTTLIPGTVTNTYYLQGTVAGGIKGADVVGQAEAKTSEEMKTDTFVNLLNNGENNWKIVLGVNNDYPILLWQTDKGRIVTTTTTKNDDKIATINVTAEDNGVEIKKYDFYINNELKHTATTSNLTASYSFDYPSTFGTTYDTYVVVTDNNNTKIKSNISTIVDYTLSTRQDLEIFRDSVNNGNTYQGETITQTANIDLEGNESNQWTPIGNYKANNGLYFAGTYNGNYKIISNLYIKTNDRNNGLFGKNSGCISNLLLENVNFKVAGSSGAVCGYNQGTISNCGTRNGEIITTAEEARTGGVVGVNCGTIQNCYNSANVKAEEYETASRHLGGIVGFNGEESGLTGKVLNCYNTGTVIGDGYVGGIVGTVYTGSSVSKCYNIANIEGNLAFGSLIGTQHIEEDGKITYNYYLEGTSTVGLGFMTATGPLTTDKEGRTESKTSTYMKSSEFVSLLGDSNWKIVQGVNSGYPILKWQQDEPKVSTLADVVSVGDYVNYDANSNGTYTFTSDDCLGGSSISATISTEDDFNSDAPSQWRVLSVDKENGIVELMSADPTAQTVTLSSGDGFINAETVLNNIGKIYGHGKGATAGRSITVEDVEQYSSYDKKTHENSYSSTGYFGGTKEYQSGKFYKETKDGNGNVTGYATTITEASETSPVTMTETYYYYTNQNYFKNTIAYNMIFKNATNTSNNKSTFWLSSRCVQLGDSTCGFRMRIIYEGGVRTEGLWYSGGTVGSNAYTVVPVISLISNVQTTGTDANGVWRLDVE